MKKNEKGQVLVLVALAMFVLLGLAALGIDVGYMYSVRHELQRSADAGALAGVAPFTTKDWTDSSVRSEAETLARDFATKNNVLGTPVDNGHITVTFPTQDHIRVDTSREVNMFFARIFGMQTRTITAHAIARAAPTDEKSCVKPWAIPLPWTDDNTANGLFDMAEGSSVKPLCETGSVAGCWPIGTPMTLKIGSPSADNSSPSGQQTSGQFFIIQGNTTDPFQGAATYRDYIAGNNCLEVDLSQPVDLMPGNKMGPTVQPVRDLIQTGPEWDGDPAKLTDPVFMKDNNRLVYVIVYNPIYPIMSGGGNGSSGTQAEIPANGAVLNGEELPTHLWFAGFYINNVTGNGNNGWITGQYTGIMLNGTGSGQGPLTGVAKHPELVE